MTGLYVLIGLACILVWLAWDGFYARSHWWRRPSLTNVEPDLFHYVICLGFVTLYVCKRCLLEAYRKLRTTIESAIPKDEREGR